MGAAIESVERPQPFADSQASCDEILVFAASTEASEMTESELERAGKEERRRRRSVMPKVGSAPACASTSARSRRRSARSK
jgi:hypothetical protein